MTCTLTIRRGEHTAIMGPNGAGKSALMHLLTHQDRPLARGDDAPSVRVFGRDRWNVFELRPQLGIVSADLHHRFVNGNSRGRIRVEDAVLSGFFGMHGLMPDDAVTDAMRTQARTSLERMDAAHLAGRFVDEMSTGEARRVLVARALVTTPQALLLDEPATGLDLVARRRLVELMDRVADAGTTLILVTHQVEEIVPSISHIVYLKARPGDRQRRARDAAHVGSPFRPVRRPRSSSAERGYLTRRPSVQLLDANALSAAGPAFGQPRRCSA